MKYRKEFGKGNNRVIWFDPISGVAEKLASG